MTSELLDPTARQLDDCLGWLQTFPYEELSPSVVQISEQIADLLLQEVLYAALSGREPNFAVVDLAFDLGSAAILTQAGYVKDAIDGVVGAINDL